jgi:hypothetical protein
MSDPSFTSPTPQFGTAEYAPSGAETCKSCNRAIQGSYYRVNGLLACESCATHIKNQLPKDTHSIFIRGIILGIAGSVLGLILYSTFTIVTKIEIGYVSLAVGWIVAKAIKWGSGGIGGRRYQIAAVALTYAAVSLAAIPIYIFTKEDKPAESKQAPNASGDPAKSDSASGSTNGPDTSAPAGILKGIGLLFLIGLASPFLELADPFHGAIGLVILFVGLNIAWRMTASPPVEILGPFTATSSPSTA